MQIADDGLRLQAEEGLEMRDRGRERFQCLQIFHIANVLAHVGVVLLRQAKGGL